MNERAHCSNEIRAAVSRATFHRARNGWRCKAFGFQAVGFGQTKAEAQTNLRNLLILTCASGVGVAKSRRGARKATPKPKISDGLKILNHIPGKAKLIEEKALAAERLRWESIKRRVARLIDLKGNKWKREESITDAIERLIDSRTDEQIQRMLYELESGEPT
jgi:hypothetical protein